MAQHKTYYRRHLPHYQPPDATYHVVFRLAGSLSTEVIEQLRAERELEDKTIGSLRSEPRRCEEWWKQQAAYFQKFNALLDGTSLGPRWLADHRIAGIVTEGVASPRQQSLRLVSALYFAESCACRAEPR